MTSLTVENYLKAMLQIGLREQSDWVSTGQLATALAVSPGTVTSMIKSLAESGLADYRPYEGVALTGHGREVALRMLRRHRLLEQFLVKTLHLTWDQVHEEAENMEHAVSDFLVDRIDDYLGRPACDPHGDPIPSADGTMRGGEAAVASLDSQPEGTRIRVVRVTNQHPDFLRYLSDSGLALGAEGTVRANSAEAGIVTTEFAGRTVSLGHPAAGQILVELLPEQGKR